MSYNQQQRDRARELRANSTPAESIVWRHLRNRHMKQFKFRRQHPIGPFFADFYCAAAQVIVELDGDSHAATKQYDVVRDEWMVREGIEVFRCRNSDVYENLDGFMEVLWNRCRERTAALSPSPPTPLPGVPGRGA